MNKKIIFALLAITPFIHAPLGVAATAPGSASESASKPASERFFFTFTGNWSGNYTMVSCDYAEYVAQDFMRKLGATNVSVNCSGGIQPYGVYPINLNVNYDAVVLGERTRVRTIDIDSQVWNSNCVFDTRLMRTLLREFKNVKPVSQFDSCFQSDSRYSYRLDVTLPDQL